MGASIHWRPVNVDVNGMGVATPSAYMQALEEAGLRIPGTWGQDDLPKLRAFRAAATDDWKRSLDAAITGIEKHGKIEIVVTY